MPPGQIRQLFNYPSIVVWTVFNEAWGEFEGRRITELIREMDSSRLVDEASGNAGNSGTDVSERPRRYCYGLPDG